MASLQLNGLIEGDFLYHPYFTYTEEDIQISSDESTTVDVGSYSDTEISESTKQQVQAIKDEIQVDELKADVDSNDSSSNVTTTSEKLTLNEESRFTFEQGFENHSIDKNTSKSFKKKKRFSTQNLIDMYCYNCKKGKKRIWGDKRTVCKTCNVSLKYQCSQCKKRYTTYQEAFSHIKIKCNQTPLFECSMCNYEARNEAKLDDHMQSRHSFQKCSGCAESYESNQMIKHQLYDCKTCPLNTGASSNTNELNVNEIESTTNQKSQVSKYGLLLEKYCKTCDESVERIRGVNICKYCKSPLIYQCIICCNRYSTVISAYQHIRCCIQLVEFHCAECGFKTLYKKCLANHIKSKHEPQECEVCHLICENWQSLRRHKKYKCTGNKCKRSKTSK